MGRPQPCTADGTVDAFRGSGPDDGRVRLPSTAGFRRRRLAPHSRRGKGMVEPVGRQGREPPPLSGRARLTRAAADIAF